MAEVIRAHITGTVWKILVSVGDEVEEEDNSGNGNSISGLEGLDSETI